MSNLTLFDDWDPQPGPSVRCKLTVAYDGTDFRGLAPNPGVRTVVGELGQVLGRVLGIVPDVVMSGRTDAGVHAACQVLSFDVPEATDLNRLVRVINRRLAPEIVALSAETVDDAFSARFSATGRRYCYQVLSRPVADPFSARTAWWVPEPLDLAAMRLACDPIIGEHDFSSFCRRPKSRNGEPVGLVRRVDSARWNRDGDLLRFEIAGSSFCHQMVRSLVGFHVAVGRGRRSAGEMRAVLAKKDRNVAESPAPPHGLTLMAVTYPD